MEKLVDRKEPTLARGTIFRFKAKYPYEGTVDFMLLLDESWERPLAITIASGYNAGHVLVYLPNECILEGTMMLSTEWLKKNWTKWIYLHCPVEDVYYMDCYPVPQYPT